MSRARAGAPRRHRSAWVAVFDSNAATEPHYCFVSNNRGCAGAPRRHKSVSAQHLIIQFNAESK